MRGLLTSLLTCVLLVGCAQSQELGASPAPNVDDSWDIDGAPHAKPTPAKAYDVCPMLVPIHGAPCSSVVEWCRYERPDLEDGMVSRCACGVDRRWTCLVVSERRNVPATDLPLSNIACTEGAPCAEGVRCTVPRERACICTSSSRLVCTKPTE